MHTVKQLLRKEREKLRPEQRLEQAARDQGEPPAFREVPKFAHNASWAGTADWVTDVLLMFRTCDTASASPASYHNCFT